MTSYSSNTTIVYPLMRSTHTHTQTHTGYTQTHTRYDIYDMYMYFRAFLFRVR